MFQELKKKYLATLKSSETEDWLDYRVIRPLCYFLAVFFAKLNIHPNAVTIASMFIGAASSIFFYHGSFYYEGWYGLWLNIIGVILLCIADLLDCTDGQLARLTGKKSRLGRILDGMAGFTWFIRSFALSGNSVIQSVASKSAPLAHRTSIPASSSSATSSPSAVEEQYGFSQWLSSVEPSV